MNNNKTNLRDYTVPVTRVLDARTLGILCGSIECSTVENYDYTDFEM